MSQSFIRGTLILSIATLLSKILGSFFRIPLQNIAGDEVLGIFSLVYPIYMVTLILSVAGIPVAISKLISEARALQDEQAVQRIFKTASVLALLFGALSFTLIMATSEWLSSILGSQDTRLAIIIVAFTLLVAPYMAVYRGFFQGHQNMTPTGVSQVIEQLVRVVLILSIAYVLVVQGSSNDVIAGGVMVGSSIGALFSLVYLRILYTRFKQKQVQFPKTSINWSDFKKTSKTILTISLPISVGAITMALMNVVDSLTVPFSLLQTGVSPEEVTYLYGIYGRGLALVQIATVFSSSVVLSLIPVISKLLQERKQDEAQRTVEKTFYLTHLLSWPIAIGLLVLTLSINLALFKDLEGSGVLAAINVSSVFTSLAILGTGILQGLNKASQAAIIIVIAVGIKSLLNFTLIGQFGLIGAGYATILIYVLIIILNVNVLRRVIPFKFFNMKLAKIMASSIIMGLLLMIPNVLFDFSTWTRGMAFLYVMVATSAGVIVYGLSLFIFKVFVLEDIKKLPMLNKVFKNKPKTNVTSKGGKTVSKKPLWLVLVLLFTLLLPGIYQRFYAEWTNNEYEMVIPFENIVDLSDQSNELSKDMILGQLRGAGLDAISLEPETLRKLFYSGDISILTTEKVNELSLLSNEFDRLASQVDGKGIFITLHSESNVTDLIQDIFPEGKRLRANGREFYFIPDATNKTLDTPLAFSEEYIATIQQQGLKVIPRIPNYSIDQNTYVYDQLFEIGAGSNILFIGNDVLGMGDPENMTKFIERLRADKIGLYTIEFDDQKGFKSLAYATDMNVIRLHGLNLAKIESTEVAVERAIRAVKERNIRSIFVRMNRGEADEVMNETVTFLQDVQRQMPYPYTDGEPQPYQDVQNWTKIPAALAAILFVMLTVLHVLNNKWLTVLAGLGTAAIAFGSILLQHTLLLQALALAVAVLTPILAVYPIEKTTNLREILVKYAKAIGVSVIGIAIVVALLNGNEFFVKMEEFRGVKLVYIFPIAFAFFYAIFGHIRKILKGNVAYWHLAVIGFIGIIGLYYISRTGNAGSVSSIELMVRQTLEELMYVRPRTKEFLIGFPIFVLTLYVSKKSLSVAKFMMIPGIIGFLSIMNTFTHLHIPLHVSVLRTIYSLVIGFILGLLLIQLYKIGMKLFEKYVKPRWLG